ncbi:sugar ABC transporter permease [Clostridia bacterium]|nr:sugar ABC transporter permease [Clostridia bacterium]
MKKKVKISLKYIALILIICLFLLPIIYMLANSFMSQSEVARAYSQSAREFAQFKIIPNKFSMEQYYQAFLRHPKFLNMFWNSLIITIPVVILQSIISIFAAYAFSKFNFWGKNKIFFIFTILLIMPLQVTLVPNYIMLDSINLLNTYLAVILPGACSAFGICLLRQYMLYVPNDTMEAAKIYGANHMNVLFKIVVPQVKGGIAALVILTFIDSWNMVEQVIIYLDDNEKYPLSAAMSTIRENDLGIIFACGIIFTIPPLLIYLYNKKEFKSAAV